MQALDPHANEYMERLKDEAVLLALAQKVGSLAGLRWCRLLVAFNTLLLRCRCPTTCKPRTNWTSWRVWR